MRLSISNIKKTSLIILINLFVHHVFGQIDANEKNPAGNCKVGYKEYRSIDSSRRYKPRVSNGNPLFYRPEEMDVWYPAELGLKDSSLNFSYFVSLFERRANTFQDSIK